MKRLFVYYSCSSLLSGLPPGNHAISRCHCHSPVKLTTAVKDAGTVTHITRHPWISRSMDTLRKSFSSSKANSYDTPAGLTGYGRTPTTRLKRVW